MIKLEREPLPKTHPLLVDGSSKMTKELARWRRGTTSFKAALEDKVWGSCKRDLQRIQHGKCCYCETKFTSSDYGAVEHYRPKNSVRGVASHSGYWWLAYSWDNLLLSCDVCNSSFKLTHFPLVDASKRVSDPTGNIDDEEPLILDPFRDEPSLHIRFRKEVAAPLTERGKATIEHCGLNRTENRASVDAPLNDGLQEIRREHYETIKTLYELFSEGAASRLERLSNEDPRRAIIEDPRWQARWRHFESMVMGPKASYLAMTRQAFLDDFELAR